MPRAKKYREVPIEKLRWRLDPASLPFKTTNDLEPLKEIVGQRRGLEALKFAVGVGKKGYNVFVTGPAGTGRMTTVKKVLEEISKKKAPPTTSATSTASRIRKPPSF